MSADLRQQLQSTLSSAYTIDRELGGGGMSRTFVAEETALGRKVVVKVLPPELAAGISVERFKREILVAAKLQQANIVPVLASGETAGLPYYTMPFVEGLSLRGRLAAAGALPIGETLKILGDVARALSFAHAHGVVHRDIKPDNVLLSGGTAVVTDFGIAKAIQASRTGAHAAPGETLTVAGTSIGTPAYMAPEQAAADPTADHRVDLYAFGIMAYEMLAGQPPFHGLSAHRLLAAQMAEAPRQIAERRRDCPDALAELVMRCLEKEPDRRPASADDVVRVLDAVTSGGSGDRAAAPVLLQPRVPLWKALALWAAAAVAVPVLARAAVIAVGLPDWVFPGAVLAMLLGLPVVLATHFVHRAARQVLTSTPTLTPGGTPMRGTMATMAVRASPHLTWRRTAMGGVLAVGALALLTGGWMALRALGIGPAGSLMAAGLLGEKERLIVADFKSPAADTTLGPVVTEAVRADLAQSRNLDVVQATSMRDALQRTGRSADERVDFTLARELATRDGIKAVLDGEILAIGGGYVLTARLIATSDGTVLASFRETADEASELIPAIGELSKAVRARVGESMRTVQRTPALDQVTTTSLDALRKYAAGVRASDIEGNLPKAAGLLREAVAIDSTFASAWRKLGIVTQNAGLAVAASDSAITKAYQHRGRLAFFEQQMAIASYFTVGGPGSDRQRAIEAFDALLERDSSDVRVFNNYALALRSRREFARAEAMYRKVVNGPRPVWQSYTGLLESQFNQGKIAAAESTLAEWRRKLPGPRALLYGGSFLLARGQLDSLERFFQSAQADRDPQNRSQATLNLGRLALMRGRVRESERLGVEGRRQNAARGAAVQTTLADSLDAVGNAVWFGGAREEAAKRLDAMLARHPLRAGPEGQRPFLPVATLYARAGAPDRARAVLAQWSAELADSAARRRVEPQRHDVLAEIALAERRWADAVSEFRQADQRPDGPADACTICLARDLARTYDLAGNADSAIAHFERYVTTPFFNRLGQDALYLAGSHKRLGELYEARGERDKALANYLKFVELWKDADPELQPRVAEVTQRIARLKDGERR